MKKVCASCEYCSDLYHELDPLGEWKWCTLHLRDVHEDDEVCENWLEVVLVWPENNKPKKEGENIMKFELGKYYRHTSGDMIATLDFLETTMWGKALITERVGTKNHDICCVGTDDEGYAQNWQEITKEEWMKNFSKD